MTITECSHKTIREWPDCYEDCDYAGTDDCPHHKRRKTMSIDEAIKINTENLPYCTDDKSFDLNDAMKLGIEALKRLQTGRIDSWASWIKPLPGETKD